MKGKMLLIWSFFVGNFQCCFGCWQCFPQLNQKVCVGTAFLDLENLFLTFSVYCLEIPICTEENRATRVFALALAVIEGRERRLFTEEAGELVATSNAPSFSPVQIPQTTKLSFPFSLCTTSANAPKSKEFASNACLRYFDASKECPSLA